MDETALATDGYVSPTKARILLIACGALAREILALNKANGWDHLHLHCLPANYHHTPDKIVAAVENMVADRRDEFEDIFVVYADCGTGGLLQAACDRMGLKMIKGPHCYGFFEGNEAFEKLDEMTAFYLQIDDPVLTELAKQHAERLGLKFERRFTGYGDLETSLQTL